MALGEIKNQCLFAWRHSPLCQHGIAMVSQPGWECKWAGWEEQRQAERGRSTGRGGHWSRKARPQFLAALSWDTRRDREASKLDPGAERMYPKGPPGYGVEGARDRMDLADDDLIQKQGKNQ